MIPKHQQINEYVRNARKKKKARLRYDNVFKIAWTDEVHFIKHSRNYEREINLHFVNSAGLIFQSITEVIVM